MGCMLVALAGAVVTALVVGAAGLSPGETLRAKVWKDGARYVGVVTAPARDDTVVLSDVELTPA